MERHSATRARGGSFVWRSLRIRNTERLSLEQYLPPELKLSTHGDLIDRHTTLRRLLAFMLQLLFFVHCNIVGQYKGTKIDDAACC